jgi:hypothetical protein
VRSVVLALCLAILVLSCAGGESTLSEYAEQLEELVTTMNREIIRLDAELESAPTVEGTQSYFREKIAARNELLEGFRAIEPPEEAATMHAAALDVVTKLTTAEEALADRAAEVETPEELPGLWNSPESRAVNVVDAEAVAFCEAAQAEFDSTEDRRGFEDAHWVPSELKEVVQVVFGCS